MAKVVVTSTTCFRKSVPHVLSLIHIFNNPNPKTVEALMSLDLPAGVEIEIKL